MPDRPEDDPERRAEASRDRAMPGKKEGRIARHMRLVGEISQEPRTLVTVLRGWILGLWMARGGGFYGLGYVVTFVALEIRTLAADLGGSGGVSDFIVGQAVQYLIRISVESFINAFRALLWPLYALQWFGPLFGIIVIAIAFGLFRGVVRPVIEAQFPELREARARKAASRGLSD